MGQYEIRTDLALEATETMQCHGSGEIKGVELEEYDVLEDVHITKVRIVTKNAAKIMGKPIGTYITLESPSLESWDEDYHREISEELANCIRTIIPDMEKEKSILIIGLGNREVTADSLGPSTVDQLFITRHMLKEYGKKAYNVEHMHEISSLIPGVMAKTGMETAEIVKGVVTETHPDILLVVDALAAKNVKRLYRAIQITDTGIHPGSGVGNHRNGLTNETLGIPVIAIGIPMVVNASTIVDGALEKLAEENKKFCDSLACFRHSEDAQLHNMYVTAKNIDETTKRLSYTLSEAINMALDMEE